MKLKKRFRIIKRGFPVVFMAGFCLLKAGAQQFAPSTHWKKIDTEHFEVVFEDSATHEGLRVANLLEYIYQPVGNSLSTSPKKISLFLNTASSYTNGNVQIGPFMSEWYNVPPLSVATYGRNDWYTLLALHEFRHVVQYNKMNRGLNHIGKILYGDYGLAVPAKWTFPEWYWEGDAVCSETALSGDGRGRLSDFHKFAKARLLEGKRHIYAKTFLGSYKDAVDGEYTMGYEFTSYLRKKYGTHIWDETINGVAKRSYDPYSLSGYLKKKSGKRLPELYKEACDYWIDVWQQQLDTLKITHAEPINCEPFKHYTYLKFPSVTPEGNVIALMVGLDEPQTLVRIWPDGKVEKLIQISNFYKISYANGLVAWESIRSHVRWGKTSWSEIMVYDIDKKQKRRLTSQTRYYAPALSPDGKKVAVVEHNTQNQSRILVLSVASGEILEALPNPTNDVLRQPSWSKQGDKLVYTAGHHNKIALKSYNLSRKTEKTLIDYTEENIDSPVLMGNKVLFSSQATGVEAIHALNLDSGKRTVVCQRKYGVYNASRGNTDNEVYFQDYTSNGFQIAKFNLNEVESIPYNSKPAPDPMAETLAQQEGGALDLDEIPQQQYEVKKYSQFRNLIHIHSWGLVPLGTEYRVFMTSTNKLKTLNTKLGYAYNVNEKNGYVYGAASYAKYFTTFTMEGTYSSREINTAASEEVQNWDENNLEMGISIPLNLSRNIYTTSLDINNVYGHTWVRNRTNSLYEAADKGNMDYLTHAVDFSCYRTYAKRDLNPRLGISSLLSYSHTPFQTDYNASLLTGYLNLWLPSVFKHHSILLQGAYEEQDLDDYVFASNIVFARGYSWEANQTFRKFGINYALPIACPDWDILRVMYLKRFSANFFYDNGVGKAPNNENIHYESVGTELSFSFHVFDVLYEISMGPRISYRITDNKPQIEFVLFGIN